MHWKAKPPSHALSTKRKIAISGCSRPCSTAKKRSHFSNRMESDPFPPHQGNDPIVGKCIFSFENERIAPGVTWCVSHHKANELQALPKRASIPRLSESSKSKTPSRQNSTMVLPMKFLAMPSRKIWNGSFLKNLPAPPVFQSSNGICLNGGGTLQGGVAYKVSVHVGLLDTSSKGYASSPALHSWQHGMKFLCPTFWYDRLSTPVLAWYSISPDMPSTAIWNKVSPTEMPSQQAVLRSTDVASKRDWRRPGVVLNFFEGKQIPGSESSMNCFSDSTALTLHPVCWHHGTPPTHCKCISKGPALCQSQVPAWCSQPLMGSSSVCALHHHEWTLVWCDLIGPCCPLPSERLHEIHVHSRKVARM